MNRFLKHWRLTGRGEVFHAHVISYADDFVILSRGHADEALAWTRAVMTKIGLTLNEAKTSVKSVVAVGLAVKPVGKPDAANPHVRFDERGRETGQCHRARPRLYRSKARSAMFW